LLSFFYRRVVLLGSHCSRCIVVLKSSLTKRPAAGAKFVCTPMDSWDMSGYCPAVTAPHVADVSYIIKDMDKLTLYPTEVQFPGVFSPHVSPACSNLARVWFVCFPVHGRKAQILVYMGRWREKRCNLKYVVG